MKTYWSATAGEGPKSKKEKPQDGGILIIGSGLAGVSTAYFLQQNGFEDIKIVDCGSENASYFRNAGHMLHGIAESYHAVSAVYGREKARTLFKLSEQFILQYHETIDKLNLNCDYHKGDYFFVGKNVEEQKQLEHSVEMMEEDSFSYSYMASQQELQSFGFSNAEKARGCKISSQANPAKFRHQLLEHVIKNGTQYYSMKVKTIDESEQSIGISYMDLSISTHDAVVIAGNAYSPLFSKYFERRKLVEPFKGQIIVSKPMKKEAKRMQFSMDHGYIYGTITADNRLLIGGWRNNVPGGEVGSYDLNLNPDVEEGLKQYIKDHFSFQELDWEYSWAGIMATSSTGLPFIGPTNSSLVFCCAGFTGYGFSFAHGSAKLLADIMTGNELPVGWEYFNPKGI